MQELPAFQDQIEQTYTSTYVHYYKIPVVHPDTIDNMHPKAPQCDKVDYNERFAESLGKQPLQPFAKKWGRSSDVIGVHPMEDQLQKAGDTIARAMISTQALEAPFETAEPMPEMSTTHYVHGPMPDRAIAQHFLHRRTTSSVVDGSGISQVVEVGLEDADPNFYYLRDADGSRKVLEVVDRDGQPPTRAQGSAADALAAEGRPDKSTPAVKHFGGKSHNNSTYIDPSAEAEAIRRRAAEMEARRRAGSQDPAYAVPDEKRITVPHVFEHVMGVHTTNRVVELKMKNMVRDPNPPRACIATADKLIYSSAPPPEPQEW